MTDMPVAYRSMIYDRPGKAGPGVGETPGVAPGMATPSLVASTADMPVAYRSMIYDRPGQAGPGEGETIANHGRALFIDTAYWRLGPVLGAAMKSRLFLIPFTLLLLLILSACDDAQQRLSALSGPTMGTTWSVKFTGSPRDGIPALKTELEAALEQVNQEMSTYRPDSDLSRFNQAEAGTVQTLPEDFAKVLAAALKLSGDTNGAYDVTVGPLVNLWGFGPDPDRFEPPADEDVQAALRRIGWQRLTLQGREATQPGGLYVDLSSIAKGFGVDKLAGVLKEAGISNYLVEVGGELVASGTKPYGQPWRVAIERPEVGKREVEKVLKLHDIAIATSGDYRNFFEEDGKLFSHTIDPRTGYPVTHHLASVTVLHKSCMMADALATALTVLGPEEGVAFAREHELPVLFIVRTNEGPKEILTPAFQAVLDSQKQEK
ncbi:FAD:protein FMN transferase [Alcanivoracaceae bacterium MT1]|jgi:FAD:protein FMN transferase